MQVSSLNVSLLQGSRRVVAYCMLQTYLLHFSWGFCTVCCCTGWQACVYSQPVWDCSVPRSVQHPAEHLFWGLRTVISCFACSAFPVTNLTFQARVQLGTGVHIDVLAWQQTWREIFIFKTASGLFSFILDWWWHNYDFRDCSKHFCCNLTS